MSDRHITCAECGDEFVFSEAEQSFYAEKGLASPPKRCRACRQARKLSQSGSNRAASAPQRGPRRYSGDVNEYRSPMGGDWSSNSGSTYARPPRGRGRDNGYHHAQPQHPHPQHHHNNNHPHPQQQQQQQHQQRRAQSFSSSEYRSPAFPDSRGPSRGNSHAPSHGNGNQRPPRGQQSARPSRPLFDIVCNECGAEAQVPFKPLEGRQVFCQPCYRARRESGRAANEPAIAQDSDVGIVE